jgi:hypothetical protein
MKEKPILFSGEMVQAILDGRKTQTRRVMKPQPAPGVLWGGMVNDEAATDLGDHLFLSDNGNDYFMPCPYGKPGDRLWVRETWAFIDGDGEEISGEGEVIYKADSDRGLSQAPERWRPSIHMPRWASRITLEVTGIRVERVQEISDVDCIAEGTEPICDDKRFCHGYPNDITPPDGSCEECSISPRGTFGFLWDSINGKRPGCLWDSNPWVFVIEFRTFGQ